MLKTYLLLVCFIIIQQSFCWSQNNFSTDLYEEMNKNGSLKYLKNLTYSTSVDWNDIKYGMN